MTATKTKSTTKISRSSEVTLEELADITGLSKTFLLDRAKEGLFKAKRHGVYVLGEAQRGLFKFYQAQRKPIAQTPAQQRYWEAKAQEIEMRNAQTAGELTLTSEAVEVTTLLVSDMAMGLDGLSASLPPPYRQDRELRRVLDDRVFKLRSGLAAKWERLRKGGSDALDAELKLTDDDEDEAETIACESTKTTGAEP